MDHKESWTPKNWCFWTVVLEKTLKSPLDCKESQPVHLKEISPEHTLEGLMLKLKLQYFGHLVQRTDSFENTLMLGNIEGGRRGDYRGWDGWMASLTRWTWVCVSSGSWWWTGRPGVLQSMGSQSWTQLSDWTELNQMGATLHPTPATGLPAPVLPQTRHHRDWGGEGRHHIYQGSAPTATSSRGAPGPLCFSQRRLQSTGLWMAHPQEDGAFLNVLDMGKALGKYSLGEQMIIIMIIESSPEQLIQFSGFMLGY